MHLKDYLKNQKYTQMSFIDLIEMATSVRIPQGTLAKWVTGTRIPRKEEMQILYKVTEGSVQPNDFYELSE
ncbi:MAG: hypothetical protein GOVbin3762_18 [Prokaryotic dsDNA virus sp.]|nr:MAG: hypothetical protein GOVbin3762_18 [Prokaryotic dsDNA virus sp.]|tara:strand:- start:4384 stop:4596 length:213 start_codon:yes stop_codon:yes gene_type:complete